MAAHQAPPSLGFSRQEHWSGLPFPSPMHESEKWKWSRSVVSWLFTTPWTAAYQAPPSMGFCRQEYWSGVPSPSSIHRFFQYVDSSLPALGNYLALFLDNFHPSGWSTIIQMLVLNCSSWSLLFSLIFLSSTLLFSTCIEFYLNSNIFHFQLLYLVFPLFLVHL